MNQNENLKLLLDSLGAISEVLNAFRDSLLENGFTRQEALSLCNTYLRTLLQCTNGNAEGEAN
jgi:hypothetical protein